jgi:UvrD-like helicase C-terminal domain
LECGPVDRTGVDAVRGETVAASPREWLQQVFAVSEPTQAKPDEVPDAIPVYTIFGAKGLQAPVVFLVNAIEQSFAGRVALAEGVRRACVGVTRARDHLLISAPLYLRGSSLEHTVGTRAGGLAQIIAGVADDVGLGIETVRPEDL